DAALRRGFFRRIAARLDDGAHAAVAPRGGTAAVVGDRVVFAAGVVADELAGDLVLAALEPGAPVQIGALYPVLMLDALGFAFDDFAAVATLAEVGQAIGAAGGDAFLETVRILGDDQLFGLQLHGALGQDHASFENVHLVGVIHRDAIRLQLRRLVA